MGLTAAFGLFQLFRTTHPFARIILITQLIAIGLTLLSDEVLTSSGLVLFMLSLVLVIIYGLTIKNTRAVQRTIVVVSAALLLLTHVFQFQNYPGAGVLGLTMILPLIGYMVLIANIKNYRNELGFMTVIAAAAAIELVRRIEWLMNQ